MRRRGVLGLGLSALVASGVAGCGEEKPPPSAGRVPSARPPSSPAPPPFDRGAYQPPDIPAETLRALFAYPADAPLSITGDRRDEPPVRVEDLSYADSLGGRIPAYVVSPLAGRGRAPGIVFAHGAGVSRGTWLQEARDLAARGAVCVLPEVSMTEPTGDPEKDSRMVVEAVVRQRRAVDLLAGRSDVDAGRLGFVGHSWGATLAQIMAGAEPRLAAVAVVAGGSRYSGVAYTSGQPRDGRRYMDALTRFDGYRFLAMPGRRAVLVQTGTRDRGISQSERQEVFTAAAGAKEHREYDAGHNLVGESAAVADRAAFLTRVLRFG